VVVAASGAASAVFVVLVNAWMNTPTGFTLDATGGFATIDPVAAMRSPAAFQQALHMLLASYAATGLAVAGVHAWMLLRGAARDFHRRALTLALLVGTPAAVLQPLSGDVSARVVADTQPVKLAALEGQWETERGAPLRIGGLPDAAREETRWALEIPYGLSLLAFHDPGAEVKGLRAVPRADRPPVAVVHFAFQTMVALGSAMALVALWAGWSAWRGREIAEHRLLLRALVVVAPFGFLATEAGWIVTEVGRQPWVVQGVMRTASAVTPMPGLVVPMLVFTCLYLGLGAIVVTLVASLVRETARPPA
jgi:cytochrome d ubiquinol oxidase subunit I